MLNNQSNKQSSTWYEIYISTIHTYTKLYKMMLSNLNHFANHKKKFKFFVIFRTLLVLSWKTEPKPKPNQNQLVLIGSVSVRRIMFYWFRFLSVRVGSVRFLNRAHPYSAIPLYTTSGLIFEYGENLFNIPICVDPNFLFNFCYINL